MLKRERLSASLAKRPSLDALQQRNILPDTGRVSLSKERLSASLPLRPPVEQLLEQHILHPADEKAEQLAKRKRLEGFLAGRPSLEQVKAHLGSSGDLLAKLPPGTLLNHTSLDAVLSSALGLDTHDLASEISASGLESLLPAAILDASQPTLDAALAEDSSSSRRSEDNMDIGWSIS